MAALNNIKNEEAKKYIYSLSEKLMRHFDLSYETQKEGEYFDFYAYHRNDFKKSFLTRSTVYEGFSIFEHVLLRVVNKCDEETILNFQKILVDITPTLASPNKFHKKSVVTGVLLCEGYLNDNLKTMVEKFFYKRNYKWCFHGWSETRMCLISLASKSAYIPKGVSDFKKLFKDF